MPYSVKGFFEINEDIVQILLMLEVLFTQGSKVEDLFCGASSGSEPSLFFSNYFFSLGLIILDKKPWVYPLRYFMLPSGMQIRQCAVCLNFNLKDK